MARQAQSKEKTLAKMVASGLTEKVVTDKVLNFYFPSCGKIPPPVIMVQNVSFRYTDKGPWIYKNLEFGIDLDTRLALVGPNGAGKSTLLKLLYGDVSFFVYFLVFCFSQSFTSILAKFSRGKFVSPT